MRTFTWDRVVAFRMRRLGLAGRSPASKLEGVLSAMCGAHAQVPTSVPLTLGARLNITQRALDRQMLHDRTIVKTWAMRGTAHVFTAGDLPLYCAAQGTRDLYMTDAYFRAIGIERGDAEAVLDAIPQALDGRVLNREELALSILDITRRRHLEEALMSGWGGLLKPAAFRGLLCFGPPDGRNVTFARPDQWLGSWRSLGTEEALDEAFRRFLRAYGPATRAEIARWWGFRPPEANPTLARLADELVEVDVDGTKAFLLEGDLAALSRARSVTGVRLLWSFDQFLVMSAPHSHAIVDPSFKRRLYRERVAVWSLPALLIDGMARGSWKLTRSKGKVVVEVQPFGKLGRSERTGIEGEADRIGRILGLEAQASINPR